MPAHLFRGLGPALSLVATTLLLASAGCGRVADRVHERMSTGAEEVIGEDWPPGETRDGLELPPWMLPPMLRGQGGGPPILGPDDHELLPSPLGGGEDEDPEDLDDEGLAPPPEEERGHEDFL